LNYALQKRFEEYRKITCGPAGGRRPLDRTVCGGFRQPFLRMLFPPNPCCPQSGFPFCRRVFRFLCADSIVFSLPARNGG
jgi:hypothetical protein